MTWTSEYTKSRIPLLALNLQAKMQSYPSLKRKEQGSPVKPGQSSEKTGHELTASKVQMDFIDSKTEENDELTFIMT